MQVTPTATTRKTVCSSIAWGYTSDTHRQFVSAPQRSGLYYFRAQTKSGAQFFISMDRRTRTANPQLAVLASNITWNAYNPFGGRSNYIHADQLPATPTVNSRFELSRYQNPIMVLGDLDTTHHSRSSDPNHSITSIFHERITDRIEGRQACHLAPAEWRLLGWLEREEFAYDYYAETQLDDDTLDLSRYEVLITAVHPEYWTRNMYSDSKHWVFEHSGKLLYLGGNGLNCEVEIDHASSQMTCHNGAIKSLWPAGMNNQDSRMAMRVESEANLLGVVFTPSGAMTGAPIERWMPRIGSLAILDSVMAMTWHKEFAHALPRRGFGA